MRKSWSLLACVALAACTTPGTGWSRASDLSVYGAAEAYARIAWEQDVLCEGASPAGATARWQRDYGGREAAVRAALLARHGPAALARAEAHRVARVPCGDVPDAQWRLRYERLLRLLEIRLGLGSEE